MASMSEPLFRRATAADLPAIIALLADDVLGAGREDASMPPNARYVAAFAAIEADANQYLAVMELDGAVMGTLQLSFLPNLSHQGMWRGQIEGVRVASRLRGQGYGRRVFEWAIDQCRARGCGLVQLTTAKTRVEAKRFYESLGFTAGHEGMKLAL